MSLRHFGAAIVSLTLLMTQAAWALTPQPVAASKRETLSSLILVQAQNDPSGVHAAIESARAMLSEMDATIAALEEDARKLSGDAQARANATLEKLRADRDAYRAQVESAVADTRQKTEEQVSQMRTALDERRSKFERDIESYFTTVNTELAARSAVFKARVEAERQYWQQMIEDLKNSATTLATQQRVEIDKRIVDLQARVNKRLAKLQQARGEAWSAMRDGLANARQDFDQTYDAVWTAIGRAGR